MKDQIMTAAVETLHQKGFNATSVQDITDAAKVPKGSFYNHFESKEALAIEALDHYWQRILGSLSLLKDDRTPPLPRLKRYFGHLNEIARGRDFHTGCMVGNLSAEMPDQSRAVREKLASVLAAWSRAIESCVREAQADGSIRDDIEAPTLAAFLLNSWQGAVMRSKVDRDARPLEAFERIAFSSLEST